MSEVWRYTAIAIEGDHAPQRGELAGDSAADVRASLRRIGLQVIDLKPIRQRSMPTIAWLGPLREVLHRHLRRRRTQDRAELYDGMATMLRSGLPLLETVDVLSDNAAARGKRNPRRAMLVQLRERLRSGDSLAAAMRAHPGWFDVAEVAMVEAGQHGGTLPEVLGRLTDRCQRSGALGQKLTGALAYPAVVALVGLGVVIFLSVKTLPDLVVILDQSGVETPLLTRIVMAFGAGLAGWWWLILLIGVLAILAVTIGTTVLGRRDSSLSRFAPLVFRRIGAARVSLQLAELLRSGVPMVDALRVLAPTAGPALRRRLTEAAHAVERGDDLADALHDGRWFDGEFRRLVQIGQMSGELDELLDRIGQRYERQSTRLIDRLASLLEPAVILSLAVLIGFVVMAAILPLVRLKEVL